MATVNWVLNNSLYEVSSLNHFRSIVSKGSGYTNTGNVPSYWSASYIQTTNINFTGLTMTPIGTSSSTPFTGNYDGNNYELQNWQNNQSSEIDYQGIFGYVNNTASIIKNITISGLVKLKCRENCGILCGYLTGKISNIILNLSLNSIISNPSYTGSGNIGGVVGIVTSGIIEYIRVTGYLTISVCNNCIGGIVGYLNTNSIIRDCIISTIGNFSITNTGFYIGGIVGISESTSSIYGVINQITGNISASNYAAGIVSSGQAPLYASANKMKGNISGNDGIGGIVGYYRSLIIQDNINLMEGTISGSTTYSGGFGAPSGSSPNISRNVIAMKGNIQYNLMFSNVLIVTTNVSNNIFSNRFGMTVGGTTTTSASYATYDTLSSYPSQLGTSGYFKYLENNIPVWVYTYTDILNISRTILSTGSSSFILPPIKITSFTFNWNETKIVNTNIGIGNTNPTKKLDITGDLRVAGSIYKNYAELGKWNKTNNDIYYTDGNIGINKDPTVTLDVNGTVRAITRLTTSDMRLKQNIQDDILGLQYINNLKPKVFTYIDDKESKQIHGFIAQDIISLDNNDIVDTDVNGFYSIDIANLITPLINSVKELDNNYTIIEDRINKL